MEKLYNESKYRVQNNIAKNISQTMKHRHRDSSPSLYTKRTTSDASNTVCSTSNSSLQECGEKPYEEDIREGRPLIEVVVRVKSSDADSKSNVDPKSDVDSKSNVDLTSNADPKLDVDHRSNVDLISNVDPHSTIDESIKVNYLLYHQGNKLRGLLKSSPDVTNKLLSNDSFGGVYVRNNKQTLTR